MWLVTMIVYQSTVLSVEPEGAQWHFFGSFSYLADWRSGNTPDFYAGDTGLEALKCHVLPWLRVLWFFSFFLGGLWNSRPILESHVITAFHTPHAPFTRLILLQESAFETFSLNTTTTNRRFVSWFVTIYHKILYFVRSEGFGNAILISFAALRSFRCNTCYWL
jgi:hypothetical protein